jgi:hypothetical protein
VIVWIASFPRSGNTFLRIVLNRLYGVRTSVVYDFDGVADRLGAPLVGFEERPGTFAAMRESPEVHLVKTHRPHDELILDGDKAICLVRDGRDCLVSWARQRSEGGVRGFADELRDMTCLPACLPACRARRWPVGPQCPELAAAGAPGADCASV